MGELSDDLLFLLLDCSFHYTSCQVWDNETFQCIETLSGHTDIVTALICCNNYLLSSSLDRTIKVWALGKEGNLEVVYTRTEEHVSY